MRKRVELSDVNRELQKQIDNGKVVIGSKETIKTLKGGGEGAKIVIHASNCPEGIKDEFREMVKKENKDIRIYEYPANSFEFGLACSKPFSVASLCIIDAGGSEISRFLSPNFRAKENKSLQDLRGNSYRGFGVEGAEPLHEAKPHISKKETKVIGIDREAGH